MWPSTLKSDMFTVMSAQPSKSFIMGLFLRICLCVSCSALLPHFYRTTSVHGRHGKELHYYYYLSNLWERIRAVLLIHLQGPLKRAAISNTTKRVCQLCFKNMHIKKSFNVAAFKKKNHNK